MLPPLLRVLRLRDAAYEVFLTVGAMVYASFFGSVDLLLAGEVALIMAFFALFSFTSNNFFDRAVDQHNPSKQTKNPYATGELSTGVMLAVNSVLAGACLLLTWMWIPELLWVLVLSILNVLLYTRVFKRYPFVDLVSHVFWILAFVLVPLWALGRSEWMIAALGILGGSNLGELDNLFRDRAEDEKAGIRTTAVAYPRVAHALSWLSTGALLVFIGLFALVLSPVSLSLVPLVVVHRIQQAKPFPQYDRVFLAMSLGVLLLVSLTLLWV